VIRFAIGRRQVTTTGRDEQSVIRSLQYAHNEYALSYSDRFVAVGFAQNN